MRTLIIISVILFTSMAYADTNYYVKKVLTDDKTYYDIVTTEIKVTEESVTENEVIEADLDADIAALKAKKAAAVTALEADYDARIAAVQAKKALLVTPDEMVDNRTPKVIK